jgi:hypothetical protein
MTLAITGCGSSSTPGVSPASYVKSFCSALQTFQHDVRSAQGQAQASMAGSTSVAEIKQKLQPFATALVAAFDRLGASMKAAGSPAISNGKTVAARFVSAFQQFRGAFVQAQSQYRQLPTDSLASFESAARGVNAQLKQSVDQLKSDLKFQTNGQLHDAALKDATCQVVKGATS